MAAKRLGVFLLIVLATAGAAWAGIRCYCTRPWCLTGIPSRDYQYRARSEPKMVLSSTAIFLQQRDGQQHPAKDIKLFQLKQPKVQIGHCSISRVALQLHRNGDWVMSLRADQNPRPEGAEPEAATQDGKFTLHLKRNQFVIKVRCYGAYSLDDERADTKTGKPVLLNLKTMKFWVQSGQPYAFWQKGHTCDLQEYFDLIDRVELEFYYY